FSSVFSRYQIMPIMSTKASTPPTARKTPKSTMPRILRSLSSCPSLRCPPDWVSNLSMFRFQHLNKSRIIHRHERTLAQPQVKEEQPDSAHGDGTDHIHGCVSQTELLQPALFAAGIEIRCRLPEQVHQAHEQHQEHDRHDPPDAALGVARQQKREGQHKVHEDQGRAEILPAM